jgi:hypothetical protein
MRGLFRLLGLLASVTALQPKARLPRRAVKLPAEPREGPGISVPRNVLGGDLECCCADVRGSGIGTGFYRDGHCSTGQDDEGRHTVCIEATEEFLDFSASVGNDLSTPNPQWMFPGVMPGDQWCLCAARYAQAVQAGKQPKVHLARTHERTLDHVPLEVLLENGVDADAARATLESVDEQRQALEGLFSRVANPEE